MSNVKTDTLPSDFIREHSGHGANTWRLIESVIAYLDLAHAERVALIARPCQNCGGHTPGYWAKHAAPPSDSVAAPSPVEPKRCSTVWCNRGEHAGAGCSSEPDQAPQAERFGPPDGVFASESGDAPQAEATPPEPTRDQEAIASRYASGEGLDRLAGDYALPPANVHAAIRVTLAHLRALGRQSGVNMPLPDGVMLAAKGALEPGEYDVVDIHPDDNYHPLRVGDRFSLESQQLPLWRPTGSYWQISTYDDDAKHAESTWVTAVRRVAPESAAKPPAELYVPAPGERVRVVEIAPNDEAFVEVGKAYESSVSTCAWRESPHVPPQYRGYICLHHDNSLPGTWCRVVPAPLTEPEPVPESDDEAIGAARHYKARGLLDVSADIGPDAMAQMDRIIESMGPDLARLMPERLPAHWEALTKERDELRSKVSELEAKTLNLDSGLSKLKEQYDGACEANARLTRAWHDIRSTLTATGAKLEARDAELESLQDAIKGAIMEADQRDAELAKLNGDCNELRSGLHMHEVHAKLQEAELARVRRELAEALRDYDSGDIGGKNLSFRVAIIAGSIPVAPTETPSVAAPAVVQREIVVGSTWRARYILGGGHWEVISITEPPQYDGAQERPFRLRNKDGGMETVMPQASVRDNYTWVSNPDGVAYVPPAPPTAIPRGTNLDVGRWYKITSIASHDKRPSHRVGAVLQCSPRKDGSMMPDNTISELSFPGVDGPYWFASPNADCGGTYVTGLELVPGPVKEQA